MKTNPIYSVKELRHFHLPRPAPGSPPGLMLTLISVTIAFSSYAIPDLRIEVGNVILNPNRADQEIEFFVENRGPRLSIAGLSFNIQIGDSGSLSRGGFGSINGPEITGVDLVSGSLFAPNHAAPQNAGSIPQLAAWTVTTLSDQITLDTDTRYSLGWVTFDTTGFDSGTWSLQMGDTLNGSTEFFQIDDKQVKELIPSITDGTLTVDPPAVPESSRTITLLALGLASLSLRSRRS